MMGWADDAHHFLIARVLAVMRILNRHQGKHAVSLSKLATNSVEAVAPDI
jgi:hypothetical protein